MWVRLEQVEEGAVPERCAGSLSAGTVAALRELLHAVRDEPDADNAICFHGASALVGEADGRLEDAVRHRETEIAMILKLYEAMRGEPASTVEYAFQGYGAEDLAIRQELLLAVQQG